MAFSKKYLCVALVFVTIFAVFQISLNYGFIYWNYGMYITGNAMAKSLLAFLSKPTTVTILIILILLDVNHLKRIHSVCTFGVAIFEKTPFFILSLCAGLLELKREMGIGARRVHPETTLDFRSRENP